MIPVDSAFISATWVFVCASRCSCAIFLWLVWGFDGKNKTKQILDLPSPGAAEGTIPSYFSIYPSKAVPALRACKIPFLPWQVRAPGSGVPLWHVEAFLFPAFCSAPDMKPCPENSKTSWFGPSMVLNSL